MNKLELVSKLRSYKHTSGYSSTMRKAADTIENLLQENQTLKNEQKSIATKIHSNLVCINSELKHLV